ncbi:hypothetical protein MAR_015604 [Mya arenaria]|uniref:Uncharacterized protein n=1 Tax=Mya arenaria TaxID=6604 RepID=A0ABY7FHS1_MYAAR|nr:hypothetical protein MAR_015604 [Mya arenaria]
MTNSILYSNCYTPLNSDRNRKQTQSKGTNSTWLKFEPMQTYLNVGIYYPAENMQAMTKGSFEVSSSRETKQPHYVMRSLTIRYKKASGDQFIFCHESIQEYLRAFDKDVYANFAGYDK